MKKLVIVLALGAVAALPVQAQEIAAQNFRIACNVSGLYADGARIGGTVSEEISADIRRANDAARPSIDVRVTSNGKSYAATPLHTARDQIAFVVTNRGQIDGVAQIVSVIYELRLDQMRLKRTLTTLFSGQGNALQSAESNCIRVNTAATAPTAAPAPAALVPVAATLPDWQIELRRKLKECAGKDPLSQQACNERMKARYCVNRAVKVADCE